MRSYRSGVVCAASLLLATVTNAGAQDVAPQALGDTGRDLVYTPVTPCRIIDTRLAGGALAAGAPRDFHVVGTAGFDTQGGLAGGCGIPSGATAVMLNFVAVSPAGPGNLRAWAFGQAAPLAAILNYAAVPGLAIANGVVVPLCNPASGPCALDLTVSANASATHLVVDALGYMQAVGPQSVTTGLLGDGAVTLAKLGSDSVDASKIVDGSVGPTEVDSSAVQLRVSGTCTAGSSIQVVNADGTVTCQAGGAGTVTSVGTGAGLTGGPVTTSGTVSVATGGIASAMLAADSVDGTKIADGSVGAGDVNSAAVQLRVGATCAAGSSIRVVNADGTVVCQPDTNNGGTVTSVGTGAGLTGGPVTTSGTVAVATGGITSSLIASGAVGADHIRGWGIRSSAGVLIPGGTAQNGAWNTAVQTAVCPTGTRAMGGGGYWSPAAVDGEELAIVSSCISIGSSCVSIFTGGGVPMPSQSAAQTTAASTRTSTRR